MEIESFRTSMSGDVLHSWAADAQKEIQRLRAELTELRKPDCRLCEYCGQSVLTAEFRCLRQPPIVCINGDAHIPLRALRLYEGR